METLTKITEYRKNGKPVQRVTEIVDTETDQVLDRKFETVVEGDMADRYYAVFDGQLLVELTASSKEATDRFLGVHDPEGTPASGMYKVESLEELAKLIRQHKATV